jgi:hypothetical protein
VKNQQNNEDVKATDDDDASHRNVRERVRNGQEETRGNGESGQRNKNSRKQGFFEQAKQDAPTNTKTQKFPSASKSVNG